MMFYRLCVKARVVTSLFFPKRSTKFNSAANITERVSEIICPLINFKML